MEEVCGTVEGWQSLGNARLTGTLNCLLGATGHARLQSAHDALREGIPMLGPATGAPEAFRRGARRGEGDEGPVVTSRRVRPGSLDPPLADLRTSQRLPAMGRWS